ncbi:hypothetical protein NVP1081O_294 [Vibrio phage 1.081.O._10N.286.52.C2]|nr:hypothetical protein NVP1081O_294 [Vibrio phage 1.081.O._10N.286.52.C2]
MAKLIENKTVKITDVGNFNLVVKFWYEDEDDTTCDTEMTLDVGDIVNLKVFEDPTVPGGVYSRVLKTTKQYTTTLGNVVQDRTSKDYVMKNDKHRIQFTTAIR